MGEKVGLDKLLPTMAQLLAAITQEVDKLKTEIEDLKEYIKGISGQLEGTGLLAVKVQKLVRERDAAQQKWQMYEQEYILPLFDTARLLGFDLQQSVKDNPGKNCAQLFAEAVKEKIWEKK